MSVADERGKTQQSPSCCLLYVRTGEHERGCDVPDHPPARSDRYWHGEWLKAVDLLDELENVVTGHVENADYLDRFTTQPHRTYLKECGRR